MFKRYEKNEAPAWQRRLILFLWGLFSATLLLFAAWATILFVDQARLDGCEDCDPPCETTRDDCIDG